MLFFNLFKRLIFGAPLEGGWHWETMAQRGERAVPTVINDVAIGTGASATGTNAVAVGSE